MLSLFSFYTPYRVLNMKKDATYQEKFNHLKDWMPSIIESIKKDLKNEHLKKDLGFSKKYLGNKNINKVTSEEFVTAYNKAIAEEAEGEGLAEFITSRWLLRHSDLYEFFERHLTQINPNFSDLTELTAEQSKGLSSAAEKQFGAVQTYLFSVLNSVVFPASVFKELETKARQEQHSVGEEKQRQSEQLSAEAMKREHEREMARLTDKYEKKLIGLQKKYVIDVEALKKQVSLLQRKLQEKA
jgi:hypothetical protein